MISATDLHLDSIRHETFVSVNERGTVASATTGVEIVEVSVRISPDPFEMTGTARSCWRSATGRLPAFVARVADIESAQSSPRRTIGSSIRRG